MERERRVFIAKRQFDPAVFDIRPACGAAIFVIDADPVHRDNIFSFVLTYDSKFAPYLQQNSSPTLRSIYRYVLFESDGLLPLQICVLLAPVVLGICLFRFMASKRTVNVYYSLGFSRQSLFWCRYMAGELLLLLFLFDPGRCKCFFESGLFWIKQGAVDCCRFRIGGFGDPIFPELCRDGAGVQLRRHHW